MTIYNQIYTQMLKLIKSGSWKIGEKIPSENYLKNHYKVNRLTVRKALELLQNESLISKQKGSRAKVISNRSKPKVNFSTTLDEPKLKEIRSSMVVDFGIKKSHTSKKFNYENVFEVKRFFYDNKEPRYIARGQVLISAVPELSEKVFSLQKFNHASLSEILVNKFNFKIYNQKIVSNSIILTKDEADFFQVSQNSAATKWVSFFFDKDQHLLLIDTEISIKNIYIDLVYKDFNNNEKV